MMASHCTRYDKLNRNSTILSSKIQQPCNHCTTLNTNKFNFEQISKKKSVQSSFKAVDERLIACNGDCGSRISLLIDHCAHGKVM